MNGEEGAKIIGMNVELLNEVKRLPVEQRIELAGAIWDTIAEEAGPVVLPVPAEHRLELDRRLADLEANPGASSPWDEVRSRLERCR
jgi:putative addiction module component (TIGR02574 family)